MAAVSASTVRSRIATVLEALTGWKESTFAPGLFGRDPQPTMHLAFAVGMPTSAIPEGQRQRLSEGAFVDSSVSVRWAYRLRGDAQVADYAAALDQEALAIKAVCGASTADGVHYLLSNAIRDDSTEGWILGTLTFRALHRIALQ